MMLTLADYILSEARRRGVLIRIDGGKLRFDGPADALGERFLNLVRANDHLVLRRLGESKDAGRWLKPLTGKRGQALVLLLPAAGTGPERYRSWQAKAPDGLEVVAVQAPGREERFGEQPLTEVETLADAIAERIAELVAQDPDRPFVLFGHSAGALVAYEVARRLAPFPSFRALAVAAAPPPDQVRTGITLMSDEELLDAMATWTGVSRSELAASALVLATMPCLRADLAVLESCHRAWTDADILDVPIAAFSGRSDASSPEAECAAWERWTTSTFTFHRFDGAHFFPVSEGKQVIHTLADIIGLPRER